MICSATLSTCVLSCTGIVFFTTSSCRMHWSTCCSKAFVSTFDCMGHSQPPCAVEKVYSEFAIDHSKCNTFLYVLYQFFCRPSNSLCEHLMRAAKNRKAPIPYCAKSSAKSSGVSGSLCIRLRATLVFSRTASLVTLMSPLSATREVAQVT